MSVPPTPRALSPSRDRAHAARLPLSPPHGMRDILPVDAAARNHLTARLVECFGRYGYDLVTTPPFEHADILERGMETVDRRDVVRFVEPGSGEVALLRPDITPQIARMVATRLREHPLPCRLAYCGTVIRRRRGRARRRHQATHAGIECIGLAGVQGDTEVIELAGTVCRAVGLRDFRIELRHARISQRALKVLPERIRSTVADLVREKDEAGIHAILANARVAAADRKAVLSLVNLYGGAKKTLSKARRLLRGAHAKAELDHLSDVIDALSAAGFESHLDLDLAETRGQAYYTGISFAVLSTGPGEPVATGGRYDDLLARYDRAAPATGFSLDVDNLDWALESANVPMEANLPLRVVLMGPRGDADCGDLAQELRAHATQVARWEGTSRAAALAYASAWAYDAVLSRGKAGVRATRVRDEQTRSFDLQRTDGLDALSAWAKPNTRASGRT